MPFRTVQSLKYYEFQSFQRDELRHGIFSRHGGVSGVPWDSLNVGASVGDNIALVGENKQRIFESLGLTTQQSFEVWQVHSDQVIHSSAPLNGRKLQKADAIITAVANVALFMRFADCVPILFYDPEMRVIAIAHAGWKGTVAKIAAKVVAEMINGFDCKPENILTAIGPSICVDHYEVGEDVSLAVRKSFGSSADEVLLWQDKAHLDLWLANANTLKSVGIQQVELARKCTVCNNEDWFSHRYEQGLTGRFGALICMVE